MNEFTNNTTTATMYCYLGGHPEKDKIVWNKKKNMLKLFIEVDDETRVLEVNRIRNTNFYVITPELYATESNRNVEKMQSAIWLSEGNVLDKQETTKGTADETLYLCLHLINRLNTIVAAEDALHHIEALNAIASREKR